MNIDSIKNGIVIDHITAGRGMEIYNLLRLSELDCSVAIIKNVHSTKLGKKDIIKIDSDFDIDMDIFRICRPGLHNRHNKGRQAHREEASRAA